MYRRIVAAAILAVALSSSVHAATKSDSGSWFERVIQKVVRVLHPLDTIDPTPPKP